MSEKQLPATLRKLVAIRASQKFREVVSIKTEPMPKPGGGEVLVKNRYVGINASDINLTAGRYFGAGKFPVDLGFELMKDEDLVPVPETKVEFLPFILSGNTALLSLDQVGDIKAGETVLVTAAAGGTGQGQNRSTLTLALHGRLIIIGFVQGHETEKGMVPSQSLPTLPPKLLFNSTSLRGFYVLNCPKNVRDAYVMKQIQCFNEGKLKSFVDLGERCTAGPFVGLEKITDAVEYLYSKKSIGKIVVDLSF